MNIESYVLQAGVITPILTPGKFFMVVDAPAAITVRFRKNGSRTREIGRDVETGYISKPGNWSDPEDRFDGFELESATGQTVRIGTSDREGDYRNFVQSVSVARANGIQSAADVTVTNAAEQLVVASNANRHQVFIYNLGAAQVRVRESTGGVEVQGAPIPPGMDRGFSTTAALYAISEGANVDLAVLEEIET